MTDMPIRSSLARAAADPPISPEQMKLWRQRAWHEQGIAVIDPETCRDPHVRQTVINEANRQYGQPINGGSR